MAAEAGRFPCPACDRTFRWKPEIAGKTARCKCGAKMKVPSEPPGGGSPAGASSHVAAPRKPAPIGLAGPAERDPVADVDWDALGAGQAVVGEAQGSPTPSAAGTVCPKCGAVVRPGAVLCTQCGTDLRSGKTQSTKIGKPTQAPPLAGSMTPAQAAAASGGAGAGSATGFKIAGWGLRIHYFGIIAYLLGMLGIIVLPFAGGSLPGEVAGVIVIGLVVIVGAAFLAMLLGPVLGVAAPAEAGRYWCIASIACYVAAPGVLIGLAVTGGLISGATGGGGGGVAWVIASVAAFIVLILAAMLFFIFYLKLMARYADADYLDEDIDSVFKWFILNAFLTWLPIIGTIITIIFLFKYLGLISKLSNAVLNR